LIVSTNRHRPNRFKSYRETHETVMMQFMDQNFVNAETLEFMPYPDGFNLKGEISCLGQIVIDVDKFLDILNGEGDNATVQTRWYSYNVLVRNCGNVLRYDNQDENYLRSGHQDEHHKHLFDWETRIEQQDSPFWIGQNCFPTLGDVLQEVQEWYWQNRSYLPCPDTYSEIGLR